MKHEPLREHGWHTHPQRVAGSARLVKNDAAAQLGVFFRNVILCVKL